MRIWIYGALAALASGPCLAAETPTKLIAAETPTKLIAAETPTKVIAVETPTKFNEAKIVVGGNDDVNAVSINNAGVIAASLFDVTAGTQSGIVLNGAAVTTLPSPYSGSGAAIPQAINRDNDVLGYSYEGIQPHLFLWKGGQYLPQDDVTLVIEQAMGPPPLPIGLTHKDEVFYTIVTGRANPTDPIYGVLPHVRSMPYLMRYQTAHSLNATGVLAGTTFYEGASAVFAGRGRSFSTLLPPGAVTASGGYVNNAGVVAGSYIDSANVQHGFTYNNGAYKSFDLPEAAQPYSMAVTALNNAGRVVGVYTSAKGGQHAFLYNGKTVSAFGDYHGQDTVAVTLNDKGGILVSRNLKQATGEFRSYRVTCKGSGC